MRHACSKTQQHNKPKLIVYSKRGNVRLSNDQFN